MKKIILVMVCMVVSVTIIKDWFSIKGDTKCVILCVDGVKVLVCGDIHANSNSSPSSSVIGNCK